jgi:hypothetical protein
MDIVRKLNISEINLCLHNLHAFRPINLDSAADFVESTNWDKGYKVW